MHSKLTKTIKKIKPYVSLRKAFYFYRLWDSNPHSLKELDFESSASTIPPSRQVSPEHSVLRGTRPIEQENKLPVKKKMGHTQADA